MQRQSHDGGPRPVRYRATGAILLVVHLLFVGWFSLRSLDVPWVSAANLTPFAGIRADLSLSAPQAARRIGAGLGLLAPLGVLLPLADGRLRVSRLGSLVRTTTAGALFALVLELLQTGVPGQVVDVDSVLLSAAGVALAHVLVVPAARARLRRRGERVRSALPRPEEFPQGATPTIPRVGIAP